MRKFLNEGNQIHNFILCVCENFCDIISYGSGSDFLTSYGSGCTRQKVMVPTVPFPVPVPVPQPWKKQILCSVQLCPRTERTRSRCRTTTTPTSRTRAMWTLARRKLPDLPARRRWRSAAAPSNATCRVPPRWTTPYCVRWTAIHHSQSSRYGIGLWECDCSVCPHGGASEAHKRNQTRFRISDIRVVRVVCATTQRLPTSCSRFTDPG